MNTIGTAADVCPVRAANQALSTIDERCGPVAMETETADDHSDPYQKSPIVIDHALTAAGAKLGGITQTFSSETTVIVPSQNVLWQPGQP